MSIEKKTISTNTHDYDTRLRDSYQKYLVQDELELIIPDSFETVIDEIRKHANDHNKKCVIDKTINLLTSTPNQNYDNLNIIDVQVLLPRTWRFVKLYDELGIEVFLEQLIDIVVSGPCAQGRTTRIYQFYEYHMSNRDEIYDKCVLKNKIEVHNTL
jgi:hypothetical protein